MAKRPGKKISVPKLSDRPSNAAGNGIPASAMRRVLNCLPSPSPERHWTMEHAARAELVDMAAAVPASKDLRADWWEIADQGRTGSCVGWAVADGLLRWQLVQSGAIGKSDHLSVRYLWMAAKETDQWTDRPTTFIEPAGTSLQAALDIARNLGIVKEEVLPFGGQSLYQDEMEVFYALASKMKVASYFKLTEGVDTWRRWLALNGPLVARLDVDTTWDNARATSGILDVYDSGPKRGGHAVAIVGYTPDRFIIRNSWGTTDWGDKGFGYASVPYATAAFTEVFGASV